MAEQWNLKKAGLSFLEQSYMSAEERRWWINKTNKDNEETNRKLKGGRELT